MNKRAPITLITIKLITPSPSSPEHIPAKQEQYKSASKRDFTPGINDPASVTAHALSIEEIFKDAAMIKVRKLPQKKIVEKRTTFLLN